MSDECDMLHAPFMPCTKCEARIAAKTESAKLGERYFTHMRVEDYELEPKRTADHGISPAQPSERAQQMLVHATVAARGEANHHAIRELREKVEVLEKRLADVAYVATSAAGLYDDVWTRLDAALKRIDELERKQKSAPSWQDLGGAGGR